MYDTNSSSCSSENVLNVTMPDASTTIFLSPNFIFLSSTYHYELIKLQLLVFATSPSSGLTKISFHLNFHPVGSCSCNCPYFVFSWLPRIHTQKHRTRKYVVRHNPTFVTYSDRKTTRLISKFVRTVLSVQHYLPKHVTIAPKQSFRIILVFGVSMQSLVEYKLRHLTKS